MQQGERGRVPAGAVAARSHTWEILNQTRGIFAKTGNRAQVRWPVIGSRAQQKKKLNPELRMIGQLL